MDVRIETMLCVWDKAIPDIFIGLVNALTLTTDEQDVRKVMNAFWERDEYNAFFMHGFGKHHLWFYQRKASNPTQCMDNRVLIVEF